MGSHEDAEECVNDTLLRAWNSIPPNRPDNLRVYLGRIARNLSIDRYRGTMSKKRGEGESEVSWDELQNVLPAVALPDDEEDEEALLRSINAFLGEQKELYRNRRTSRRKSSAAGSSPAARVSRPPASILRARPSLRLT